MQKLKTPNSPIEQGPVMLNASRFAPEERRRLSAPGFRTFINIAELWGLTEADRLAITGSPSRSAYYGWAKTAREHHDFTLSVDALTRLSAVLGVYQSLRILYRTEDEATAWLKTPNTARVFGGLPPIKLMTEGTLDGLMTIRRYLDGARGGVFAAPNAVDENFTPYTPANVRFL